ncbi:MAG: hypothetical protein LBI33_08430 [Propionibacteriaceae bacterium]|nr:hypothetical protein [Propionibacteriaceae bacterium]
MAEVRGRESGSSTLAVIVVSAASIVVLLVGTVALRSVLAAHEAREAADLAALSAATQATRVLNDDEPCAAARQVATTNGAELTGCEIVRAGAEVAVRVEVTVALRLGGLGLPGTVSAVSYAGNPEGAGGG